jgi:hypothetical protein
MSAKMSVASTFASTPLWSASNLLICNRFYLLKLLIILWSQVQVLVAPPLKKPLIFEVNGYLTLVITSLFQAVLSDVWLDK